MTLKQAFLAIFCVTILISANQLMAADYKGDEVLKLDPTAALLSPTPLGPPGQFVPSPVQTSADNSNMSPQINPDPKAVSVQKVAGTGQLKPRVATMHMAKPRGAARLALVRRHGNPLDAQASDTRIQVWPCNSGGICEWQR